MKKSPALRLCRCAMTLNMILAGASHAADWPRFRGPAGDGISPETGLLKHWPEGGPPLLWTIHGLGKGYASVTIADGRLFTMGDVERDGEGKQFLLAYDLASHTPLWEVEIGPPHKDGARCTPTVDGDRVYAIGTDGDLMCVRVKNGELVWQKSFRADFDGKMMSGWRYSESPLVDGDKLVCTPGGEQQTVIALNKETGELVWACPAWDLGERGKDGAGYGSIVISEACGIRQYVQILGRGAVGIRAEDGKRLWSYNRIANKVANIPNPIVRDDQVFVTTSYKTGSALLHLKPDGDGILAEEVWFLDHEGFENQHGGVVLVGDQLYGGDGQNNGRAVCLDVASGDIRWKEDKAPARGSAAVLFADGNLIFRYDSGPVYLVEATPEAYRVKGHFEPVTGENRAWAHPVIHEGKLYLRHWDILACYDLRAGE